MLERLIVRTTGFNSLFAGFLDKWVENKTRRFADLISAEASILDLGSGNCRIAEKLLLEGYQVTTADIRDLSVVSDIKPVVYNGEQLPFEDNSFDTVLLLTVLHHSENPEQLLLEARRVAKNVIIIEDVYKHFLQKVVTQLMDTLVNLGYSKMTYQNKKEEEWEELFKSYGMEVVTKRSKSVLAIFRQTTYYLTKQ